MVKISARNSQASQRILLIATRTWMASLVLLPWPCRLATVEIKGRQRPCFVGMASGLRGIRSCMLCFAGVSRDLHSLRISLFNVAIGLALGSSQANSNMDLMASTSI